MKALHTPSPNFGPRRDGLSPRFIVLHYTAMEDAEAALERLCAAEFEVSAHYLIARDGVLHQLVDDANRAWHAGAGRWRGLDDINSRSIGIELDNDGQSPFSQPLMKTLEALLPELMRRWSIPPQNVIGHSDMAPERKFDPGPRFDWARLARLGLSVWPVAGNEADVDEARFSRLASQFGYSRDASYEVVLSALRQRFRPWANGPLDALDMGIIAEMAARYGVDPAPKLA